MLQWIRRESQTYFGNATSTRDFRVQMRGFRAPLLFGAYLLALILVSFAMYSSVSSSSYARYGMSSPVYLQSRLREFYEVVLGSLSFVVVIVAPALSATAIVLERQRQSLDLIFSAPVSPKYFLIGKLISSYRFIWMMLALSLPITAIGVMLGGASWSDIAIAYILLSFQTLVITAISLLISCVATKLVAAILWSYGAIAAYVLVTGMIGVATAVSLFSRGGVGECAPIGFLNPFSGMVGAGSYSIIGTTHVPNWILGCGLCVLMTRFVLLAAGAILAPPGGKELASLRINTLIYLAVASYFVGPGMASSTGLKATELGEILAMSTVILFVFMPMLSTFGIDSERRYVPDGLFRPGRMLAGTPSGSLPYLLGILLAVFLPAAGSYALNGGNLTFEFWSITLYTFGFWTLFWSIGRAASATFAGLKTARTMQFASVIFLCALPLPMLMAVDLTGQSEPGIGLWNLFILRPLTRSSANFSASEVLAYAGIFVVTSLLFIGWSELAIKRKERADGTTFA